MEIAEDKMQRRTFIKGAAISAMGMLPMTALLGCGSTTPASGTSMPDAAVPPTPPAIPKVEEGRTLTLAEVNKMRQELIDSKQDYVCEDGTVIPALYVKVRALLNSIGLGIGSPVNDSCFQAVMHNFSEEQAHAYLEMPWGVMFNATDFAEKAGRDEKECSDICETMASQGLLYRARRGGVAYYHVCPEAHGIWEYNLDRYESDPDFIVRHYAQFSDITNMLLGGDTGFYYVVPVSKQVTTTGEILLHDDWEAHLERNSVFGVSPCQCRLSKKVLGRLDPNCNHPMDTCITTGEEAEYYIEKGIARKIDRKEALSILQNAVDVGMVIQSCYSKDTEVICCCHSDCCGILNPIFKAGPETFTSYPGTKENMSHYRLVHDQDACIKCGACQRRCTMVAVTLDPSVDDGYPQTSEMCIHCGSCGLTCPVEARKLELKESFPELPQNFLEDLNLKTEYRFRTGQIY
jgi:NAD-dependent dihydropyrimidine dehydrogenase PreA subunit